MTDLADALFVAAARRWPGKPYQVRGRPGELFPLVAVEQQSGDVIFVDAS
jgi:hypothetical protein